jgi:cell division protein FtsL
MEQRDTQAEKKMSRVPRLSKLSKLLLIVGIFIIVMVPIVMVYRQQPVKRSEMEQELTNLQKILDVPLTEKERLQAEINKAEAVTEVAMESFPKLNPGVDIVEGLFELADKSDLIITYIETELPKEEEKKDYPFLIFKISITGQISKVQNFLLQVNDRYPTSVIKKAELIVRESEGLEDISILTINITYLDETLEEDDA